MRKRALYSLAAAMLCLAWSIAPIDDAQTVRLAQVLYHHCGQQSDETMRLFGAALCNRVGMREFGDTLGAVLADFACTPAYDERALACARALAAGRRSFDAPPEEVVHAVGKGEDQSAYASLGFWRVCGDYVFYYRT